MRITFDIPDITDKEAGDIIEQFFNDMHEQGIMVADYEVEEV